MNDAEVAAALRSADPLVLVEAPAGFGKTFQGADYAGCLSPQLGNTRALIVTHTHAAREVFAKRTQKLGDRIQIRTIHSLITEIANAYHIALGLPENVAGWACEQGENGFDQVATKVAALLENCAPLTAALVTRYRYLICDEHQDASAAQNQIILALKKSGCVTRIFGDPMQSIYARKQERAAWSQRWTNLRNAANCCVELGTPHRWKHDAPELGDWIRDARNALKAGNPIDLRRPPPKGLLIIRADNTAQRHGLYAVNKQERKAIDNFVRNSRELLILAATNDTVRGLRSFFNRTIPIWEGHTRDALSDLVLCCQKHTGSPVQLSAALISFLQTVLTGFSDSAFANALRYEVRTDCTETRRGKSAKIQNLARVLLKDPNHVGIAKVISQVHDYITSDPSFNGIKIDLARELHEAQRLAHHESAAIGFLQMSIRRTFGQSQMPPRVISTIHKAKGLEKENVLIVPCDRAHFDDSEAKRCLLYVALSRPTRSLAIVVPNATPSPLWRL